MGSKSQTTIITNRLCDDFFTRDVLEVAPDLIGKVLCRRFENGIEKKFLITETEAYRGEEDLACHASKGRTNRTEIMYAAGGHIYVYLIYGMYWMLNFVTGPVNHPQAVLIRGLKEVYGPGRLSQKLKIDKSFYGENLITSNRLFVFDYGFRSLKIITAPRVGIDYAGDYWKNVPWRFILQNENDIFLP